MNENYLIQLIQNNIDNYNDLKIEAYKNNDTNNYNYYTGAIESSKQIICLILTK